MHDIYDMPAHFVRRMNQASIAIFLEAVSAAGYDLTPLQYEALTAIESDPGLDQATVSGRIAYTRVTVGGAIDRLESKGYVRRLISPHDRRSRRLYATDDGLVVLGTVRKIFNHVQFELLGGLDLKEQALFKKLLVKATDAVNLHSRAPLKVE
ncbi:MarR family winged helix-turn-helix transcriptional regulator [Rhizobium halophytocola]|uniref:DNA-binding MarR family transcriptional regulator n=1 Tax=Rhizobium halophytocola TaxID=735519 RepID=A0ABS4E2C2_9HYPH|nr:MarR family transcriptional regulator [Rhizobium halophytocola]MBP1852104.1 DNA-binding MarR family transcriptional regulator [Rhizobium halophytocola]